MNKQKSVYCDDAIQLGRYHRLVESLCAKDLSAYRNMSWVDSVDEPVFVEEPGGVHVTLHDVFADDASDALYDVHYEYFVAYYGKLQLKELSVDPVPSALVEDLPFPWEGGELDG